MSVRIEEHLSGGESTGFYPRVKVDAAGAGVVSHAGAVLLIDAIRAVGLDRALSAALAPWRRPLAGHDPAKVVLDLAVALALGGDCLADIALLRARAGGVRAGGLGSDGVPADRRAGRRRRPRRWRRSHAARAARAGAGVGDWPASTPPTTASTPTTR